MEEVPTIYKEFNPAVCGNRFYETVKLENKSKETTTFSIVPSESKRFNGGFERLTVYPERMDVPSGKTGRFKLTYISHLENIIDNITYDILESDKLMGRLNVRAKSVGPLMSCKSNTVKFLWFRNIMETTKRVELTNSINFESKFCFDIDRDGQTFQISPLCGVIPAGTKLSVKLTFQPSESGVYCKKIFCLFQYQEPLILNLIGICYPKLRLETQNLSFNTEFLKTFPNSYQAYMQKLHPNMVQKIEKILYSQKCTEEYKKCAKDLITTENKNEKGYRPPCDDSEKKENEQANTLIKKDNKQETNSYNSDNIFLTNYFIDIKNLKKYPSATTLVNLSPLKRYAYHWQHDLHNHFQVEPCKGIIFPNEKINFCLFFTPSIPDQLYHKEIDLRIFPHSDEAEENIFQNIQLPLTLSLKIVGHAFLSDCCGWIPQCKVIPKNFQLPSCVPGEVVYGTFMVERWGHLPVTFSTCLSKDSNYTIQPPLGCIYNDFQLFVIQFNGKSKEGLYVEDLKIIYNNSLENVDLIKLKTSVEIPEIVFGQENFFNFDCTFPGSKTEALVPVENCTNLHLNFKLEIPEDISWLDISDSSGIIEPMSLRLIKIIFKPEKPCEYEGRIMCIVNSTSKIDYYETVCAEVMGSCQFGYLIATPNTYDFGESNYYEKKKICIHLFNFSPVVLHYKLCFQNDEQFALGGNKKNVKIKPDKGFILGKASTEVVITIQPHEKGIFKNHIVCLIMDSDSENAMPCDEPTTIFTLKFKGVLPTFQITDLSVDNGGPLFSPHWLWKMLSINSLNQRLDCVESNMEEPLNLYFPEAVLGSPKLNITLLLEANQFGEISWKMKKAALYSLSNEENMDKHEEYLRNRVMSITPMEGKLNAKHKLNMHIIISYEYLEGCSFEWTIFLPHNRTVSLKCTITTLPYKESLPPSILMPLALDLMPVYIGDEDPPLQLFWLYNNTSHPSSYNVQKMIFLKAPEFTQNIFNCINPTGIIPPFSCVPLKILFKPTEIKSYSAKIILCNTEGSEIIICIKGKGIPQNQLLSNYLFEETLPEKPKLRNENISLECNVNFINVPYIRSFSQVKRIFFIRNASKKYTWAFQWHLFFINDLIKAHVEPCKGKIEPKQEAIMTLVLNSFGYSSFINFSLPCDVINYSSLAAYETYNQYYDTANDNLKDYFTITDKGMSFDMPDIPEPEKPLSYHLFLAVNVNVIGPLHVDQKLLVAKEEFLNSSKEIEFHDKYFSKRKQTELPLFKNVLEKIFWNILNSESFKKKINMSTNRDYNYLGILPINKKKRKGSGKTLSLPKNFIQSFLEDMIQQIIYKNCQKQNLHDNSEPLLD